MRVLRNSTSPPDIHFIRRLLHYFSRLLQARPELGLSPFRFMSNIHTGLCYGCCSHTSHVCPALQTEHAYVKYGMCQSLAPLWMAGSTVFASLWVSVVDDGSRHICLLLMAVTMNSTLVGSHDVLFNTTSAPFLLFLFIFYFKYFIRKWLLVSEYEEIIHQAEAEHLASCRYTDTSDSSYY